MSPCTIVRRVTLLSVAGDNIKIIWQPPGAPLPSPHRRPCAIPLGAGFGPAQPPLDPNVALMRAGHIPPIPPAPQATAPYPGLAPPQMVFQTQPGIIFKEKSPKKSFNALFKIF